MIKERKKNTDTAGFSSLNPKSVAAWVMLLTFTQPKSEREKSEFKDSITILEHHRYFDNIFIYMCVQEDSTASLYMFVRI